MICWNLYETLQQHNNDDDDVDDDSGNDNNNNEGTQSEWSRLFLKRWAISKQSHWQSDAIVKSHYVNKPNQASDINYAHLPDLRVIYSYPLTALLLSV